MSVSGGATATYTSIEGANTGNPIGMNSGLTFTGSGELDNGTSFTLTLTDADQSAFSGGNINIVTPSMGAFKINTSSGGGGIDRFDDKMPTAVGILSSKRSIPPPPEEVFILNAPMLGVTMFMLPPEKALWSASVNVNVNEVPLSSSPEPVNVRPEFIPIGLPVFAPSIEVYVAVAPPDTLIAPA